ncbi:MAG: hypothetical protein AABW57_00640 [Nanoarchaeota archaeon]
MKIKEFLKPTLGKIILFILLMGVINYFLISTTVVLDARILVGLPFGFYPIGGFMIWPGGPSPPVVEFSYLNFIIDLIFWYLISCLIIAWYKSSKRWNIFALFLSFVLILTLILFLFINLIKGNWGFTPHPILTFLFIGLIMFIYLYLLKKFKLFDITN